MTIAARVKADRKTSGHRSRRIPARHQLPRMARPFSMQCLGRQRSGLPGTGVNLRRREMPRLGPCCLYRNLPAKWISGIFRSLPDSARLEVRYQPIGGHAGFPSPSPAGSCHTDSRFRHLGRSPIPATARPNGCTTRFSTWPRWRHAILSSRRAGNAVRHATDHSRHGILRSHLPARAERRVLQPGRDARRNR